MRFWKSYICSNKLVVQETNCCFSQFNRIRNHLSAGLRLDGIPALDLWDLIVSVLVNTSQTHDKTGQPVVNCDKSHGPNKRSQGMINVLNKKNCVPSNVQFSHQEALLYEFEDNKAVIKMIIKGRSPTMRHVNIPLHLGKIHVHAILWTESTVFLRSPGDLLLDCRLWGGGGGGEGVHSTTSWTCASCKPIIP